MVDTFAQTLLYHEIPRFFTWANKTKKWHQRKQGQQHESGRICAETLGRIPTISLNPRQTELYYLRMLLHHVRGAKSFSDLKSNEAGTNETFEAACRQLGLLTDDAEADKAMEESASIRTGSELREVFCTILLYAAPPDPRSFWTKWEEVLAVDLMKRYKETTVIL